MPIAAFATLANPLLQDDPEGMLELEGLVANENGTQIIRKTILGKRKNARSLGFELAEQVKQAGGATILHALYGD